MTTIDPSQEHVLPNSVIVYSDEKVFQIFSALVTEYEDVFTDTGVTIDIPED